MSLVERLAEKRSDKPANELSIAAARWWLNAIADEFGEEARKRRVKATHFQTGRDWLRAQADKARL